PPPGSPPLHTPLATPARTVPRLSSLRPLPILAEDLLMPDFCSGPAGLSGRSMRDYLSGALILGSFGKSGYRTYVGWTTDLDRRLAQHNAGTGARSTRGRVWVLLYAEQHATRREAMSREWHLKRDRRLRKRLARSG